jgi:hypothetical protein
MSFCTDCGAKLIQNAKFCSSCGASISIIKKRTEGDKDKRSAYKEIMHKRSGKSLEDNLKSSIGDKAKEFLEDKAKEIIEEGFSKSNNNASKSSQSSASIADKITNEAAKGTSAKSNKWILFYIVVNILFVLFNSGSEEITGILIFSVIVGIIYFIRKKKEKPINIIAKIVLVLQAILAFSIIMQLIEFIGSDVLYLIIIVCLVLLIFINVKLIISVNKKS